MPIDSVNNNIHPGEFVRFVHNPSVDNKDFANPKDFLKEGNKYEVCSILLKANAFTVVGCERYFKSSHFEVWTEQPPKRYYFVSYVINIGTPIPIFTYSATDYHPFTMFPKNDGSASILSYQEITKAEYDLFKDNQ